MKTHKDQRSTIADENLQEFINAATTARGATLAGQQQYTTPTEWAELFTSQLPCQSPSTVLDPQSATGQLLKSGFYGWNNGRYGIEMDKRIKHQGYPGKLITGNSVTVWDLMEQHFPETNFVCQVANPPFGITWKLPDGSNMDSTEYTWQQIQRFAAPNGYGYFIANHKTIERLGLHEHPWTYLYQKLPVGLWKQCDVSVGVIHWQRSETGHGTAPMIDLDTLDVAAYRQASKGIKPKTNHYNPEATLKPTVDHVWGMINKILEEDSKPKPFNVWMENGMLQVHLSTRFQLEKRIPRANLLKLLKIQDCHPLTLTTEANTRKILQDLVQAGVYTVSPEAQKEIKEAMAQVLGAITPIMPATDFESVSYADELEALHCINAKAMPEGAFTQGNSYALSTGTYTFTQAFGRKKQHFTKEGGSFTLDHSCELSGQDRYIQVIDDEGRPHRFMDRPAKVTTLKHTENEDSLLWKLFNRPNIPTIKEIYPERYAEIQTKLETITQRIRTANKGFDFSFYPGQIEYLSRVGLNSRALVAADVGCGKTLMGLTLLQLQLGIGKDFKGRALIIAPQGTIKSQKRKGADTVASQWAQEIKRFAPGIPIYTLAEREDFHRLKQPDGTLPRGIYISYYEAMFRNGSLENLTATWDHKKLCDTHELDPGPSEKVYTLKDKDSGKTTSGSIDELYTKGFYRSELEAIELGGDVQGVNDHCRILEFTCTDIKERYVINGTAGVGRTKEGINCIAIPCLSTEISTFNPKAFDAVLLDEAQIMTNLSAQITGRICRMQPDYRYALTATPIPNIVSNLFSIMGWLSVDDWYRGERRNATWPYAIDEIERFNDTFLSTEQDFTSEDLRKEANPDYKGKCLKASPVISSPARLLKLIKPTLAFISKEMCNPDYQEATVTDVRVSMGTDQSTLYDHFLDGSNVPAKNAWQRAGIQITYLREVAAAPATVKFGGPSVGSRFNPKIVACLELVSEMLERGEQVVIVSSRIEQTNAVHDLLGDAIGRNQISRIDSEVGAKHAAHQSQLFKSGKTRVHLMGIKCAAGHSYSHCPNEIILSIEFSYGPFHQAKGRVDRVNSAQPANIYVILHKDSIEESMYDRCATKQDAATICLHGKRIPRDFQPIDVGDVLAQHVEDKASDRRNSLTDGTDDEDDLENAWPALMERIQEAAAEEVIALPDWLASPELPAWLAA